MAAGGVATLDKANNCARVAEGCSQRYSTCYVDYWCEWFGLAIMGSVVTVASAVALNVAVWIGALISRLLWKGSRLLWEGLWNAAGAVATDRRAAVFAGFVALLLVLGTVVLAVVLG